MVVALAFEVDNGSRAIATQIEINQNDGIRSEEMDFAAYYQINETANLILKHQFQRIALQFPDTLLRDVYIVQEELRLKLEGKYERVFVLGDTSYGSCCVDEVAGHHLNADCIVHYGRTCLSPTSKIPVIYVLGNAPLDVDHCVESLEDQISRISSEKTIILLYEACYHYLSKRILDILQERNPSMILRYGQTPTFYDPSSEATTHSPANKENTMIVSVGSHKVENFPHEEGITAENSAFLYIGQESPHLTSMLMRFSTNDWYSYNPVTYSSRKEGALLNKSLMKRFFLVQKAKEAQIFGILLGTLGVAKYLDVVNNLQKLIKASGRKSYMFVVGKINVPKLANYAEIDAFVLVACHQNSLMDSKDFFKPIITPFELQLALSNSEEWTGQFKTDFHEVLQTIEDTTKSLENEDVDEEDADQPYFSLVSGTYKVAQSNKTKYSTFFSSEVEEKSDQAIQLKNLHTDITAYRSEAGEFLATREYRGLEPRIGETQAHAAVLGSAGIARGYEHEQEESS